ncbi:hypothetical protein ACU4GG_24525 [Streptomyces nojiriensis]
MPGPPYRPLPSAVPRGPWQAGALALLVQRSDQSDRQLADHGTRLDALERSGWPLASVTALAAVSAVAVTAWQISGQ